MKDRWEGKSREEIQKLLSEIYSRIDNDPKMREKSERYQKEFGSLNEKELRRTVTV